MVILFMLPAIWHASSSTPDLSLSENFLGFSVRTLAMLRGISSLVLFEMPTSSMGLSQSPGRLEEPKVAQMTNLDILRLSRRYIDVFLGRGLTQSQ